MTVVLVQPDPRRGHAATVIAAVCTLAACSTFIVLAPASIAMTLILWSCIVVAAAFFDMHTGRLPDVLVLPGIAAVFALTLIAGRQLGALSGAALLGVPMFVVHLVRPDGLGFGDVKFGMLLGAGIGLVAAPLVLPAYLLAAATHAVICVVVRARSRLVPFGPALAGASIVTVVAGLLGRL